jgi:hypothetical protein
MRTFEYRFEPPEFDKINGRDEREHTLAYIVGAESGSPRTGSIRGAKAQRRTIIGGSRLAGRRRDDRDRLEPRRA